MEIIKIIKGVVRKGQSRGKQLGFPTINFPLNEKIAEGVYFSHTVISGKKHNGLTFIGAAKTFDETNYQAETYILDFKQDIYGEEVSVVLLKKLRDNQKFASKEDLIKQMNDDKKEAEIFFNTLHE